MGTPLYKHLKQNGTSFYCFPSSAEDIQFFNQNNDYNVYFSKYTLLNLPKQQIDPLNNDNKYFDFDVFKTQSPSTSTSFKEQIVESIRNYVANFSASMRNSKVNNTDYYYNPNILENTSEKIFWRWCKKLNLISFELADPNDEYFSNLPEFERNNITDDSYFQEYLWRERKIKQCEIKDYYETVGQKLEIELSTGSYSIFRIGDKIRISGEESPYVTTNSQILINGNPVNVNDRIFDVIEVKEQTNLLNQRLVLDADTTMSGGLDTYTGTLELSYNKLVQYIGDINGVNNIQLKNISTTEIYAHIPDHTGQTPDILFRTKYDDNFKPNLTIPILPSQIQAEIVGAENLNSPIRTQPQNYPGTYFGQFDSEFWLYEIESGDVLRRSGDYYGIDGNINDIKVLGNIDGISLDLDVDHYVKMNIPNNEIGNFDQFNALEVDNKPPKDFEFNAILWYYNVEDKDGNVATNLYGISFIDNPDNNIIIDEVGLRIQTLKKLVATDNQDGTAYSFSINLNVNIVNDNPQDLYNPEAINSLFSFNLYNNAMKQLAIVNESFIEIISYQNKVLQDVENLKQLLYTQRNLDIIDKKIENLEKYLILYKTNQIETSETIEVSYNESINPPSIFLDNIDTMYKNIFNIKTSTLYDDQQILPHMISVNKNKNFLINIINDDVIEKNTDKLVILIENDLYYKQNVDIYIDATDTATQNKKLEIYINHKIAEMSPIETKICEIDLPIYFNESTGFINSAKIQSQINLTIDINSTIELKDVGTYIIEMELLENENIINNILSEGDYIYLDGFIIDSINKYNFSGQYKIFSINNNTIQLDISKNQDLIDYTQGVLPFNFTDISNYLLSGFPILKLNKGGKISISRILTDQEVDLSSNTHSIKQVYKINTNPIDYPITKY